MVNKFSIRDLGFYYDGHQALRNVTLDVPANQITVVFGPSHAGKSTLLRCLNRLNDLIENVHLRLEGQVLLDGEDIYRPGTDVTELRRRVGMVFALPIPLPLTIRQNVTYGPVMSGEKDHARLDELVERCPKQAAIWDEVKDRLDEPAMRLSGGQQQRLCIARSLALSPEVLLLDEPTSGLDPISTSRVEQSLFALREQYAIVIVPHSVQQAARLADYAAFLLMGELIEAGPGGALFSNPKDRRTEDYIVGRFG